MHKNAKDIAVIIFKTLWIPIVVCALGGIAAALLVIRKRKAKGSDGAEVEAEKPEEQQE